MAISILDAGTSQAFSNEITVSPGDSILLSIYTDIGVNMPSGPVLSLERQDINGNFINVATVGFGRVTFTWGMQQIVITSPGVYRVNRPDISFWGVSVGIQQGE